MEQKHPRKQVSTSKAKGGMNRIRRKCKIGSRTEDEAKGAHEGRVADDNGDLGDSTERLRASIVHCWNFSPSHRIMDLA
jgi:hypothetical protein